MDCRNALDILEAARPGSDDRDAPEMARAATHVEFCPECDRRVRVRETLDRKIGRAMRGVPVPSGLKERLLAALEADRIQTEPPALAEPAPVAARRRAWLKATAVAAACLVLGVVCWWQLRPRLQPGLSLTELRQNVPVDLADLEAFDGEFEAELPGGTWRFGNVKFLRPARGFLRNRAGKHRMALYSFQVRGEQGQLVEGVLVVVPKASLEDPPERTHFTAESHPEDYAERESGTFDTVAWTEGELVYMCFVPVGEGRLDAIERALSPPAV